MKDRYDFSKVERDRVVPAEPEPEGKVRITLRLDQDIFQMAEASGVWVRVSDAHQCPSENTFMVKRYGFKTRCDVSSMKN